MQFILQSIKNIEINMNDNEYNAIWYETHFAQQNNNRITEHRFVDKYINKQTQVYITPKSCEPSFIFQRVFSIYVCKFSEVTRS